MLTHITPAGITRPFGSYSHAVEIPPGARVVHVAGQVGATPEGRIPEDVDEQARLMFDNLQQVLHAAGMTLRDVVHVNYYIRHEEDLPIVRRYRDALFVAPFPAASLLIAKALGRPEWRFEIDCVAAKVDGAPATSGLAAADVRGILHPQTDPVAHQTRGPFILAKGDGIWVQDDAGKRYIEAMSSLWCANLGFSNKDLAAAAHRQLVQLPTYHTFNHRSNPASIALSEELRQISPIPDAKVSFTNSGAEANETMVKLVWLFQAARGRPHKRKIICREDAFHGATTLTTAMSGLRSVRGAFIPAGAEVLFTDSIHAYRRAAPGQSHEDYFEQAVANLERLIAQEGADAIGAMIVEPVCGAGGVLVPTRHYYERLAAVLRRHDILLLSDEVITGFGRTGQWFGCETFGFTPDMMSVAKGLSSGYQPIGAALISDAIYQAVAKEAERLGVFGHGFTYGGHPVTAAVACEALRSYKRMDVVRSVQALSEPFAAHLQRLAQHPLVGDARSCGLVGALELVAEKANRTPFDPVGRVGRMVLEQALERGLIVRNLGDVIALCPPLIIQPEELDELFDRLKGALDAAADILNIHRPQGGADAH